MDSKEFFLRLGKALYKIDGAYDIYAKNNNINAPNLLWVLYALNDDLPHSQKSICDGWSIPRSTINTIIKDLESLGYVRLNHLKGTRREMIVELTESGKVYANDMLKSLYEKEKIVYSKMKKADEMLKELEKFSKEIEYIYEV